MKYPKNKPSSDLTELANVTLSVIKDKTLLFENVKMRNIRLYSFV